MRVMTIVGTRPELIKLSRVIAELDRCFEHTLVHTGQNYDHELNQVFFDELGIRAPDEFLGVGGGTAMETVGRVLVMGDEVLTRYAPDALVVLGDTNSCLVVIAAKRRKIPIFHLEAGNRCFDMRVPEEINRRIVDHVSDVNLVYTEHARRYLLAEGIPADRVIKTGSPMQEVLEHHGAAVERSDVLAREGLVPHRYMVVSAHREENVDVPAHLESLISAVERLAQEFDMPVLFSVHPRTRKRLQDGGLSPADQRIRMSKPFGFLDYIRLQREAFCVLSDSGTITEEASLLGFPAVTMRQAHERPEGMDEGTLVMSGVRPDDIVESVRLVTSGTTPGTRRTRLVQDYDVGPVSTKVARIVKSYTPFVNRVVWGR